MFRSGRAGSDMACWLGMNIYAIILRAHLAAGMDFMGREFGVEIAASGVNVISHRAVSRAFEDIAVGEDVTMHNWWAEAAMAKPGGANEGAAFNSEVWAAADPARAVIAADADGEAPVTGIGIVVGSKAVGEGAGVEMVADPGV